MNDVFYEFESLIKYRKLNPKRYLAILIAGILLSVRPLLGSLFFIIFYLFTGQMVIDLSGMPFFNALLVCIIFFFLPLTVFVGAIRIFTAKAYLRFTFRSEAVDILNISKKKTVTVPYSNITAVRTDGSCYFFYTSKNLAYLLSKEALGNVGNDEFSGFIREHMGIKVIEKT